MSRIRDTVSQLAYYDDDKLWLTAPFLRNALLWCELEKKLNVFFDFST